MSDKAQQPVASPLAKPPSSRRVGRPIVQSVGGQISYVCAQLVVLAALARFEGVEVTGAFGIAMAVATPVFLLANMGLRTGLSTDSERMFAFPVYTGLAIVTGTVGIAFCVIFGSVVVQSEDAKPFLTIISLMKAVESLSLVCYGGFQRKSRMNLVARSLGLRGWLSAGLFVLLLAGDVPVAGAFGAQLVVWFAVLAFHDYPQASRLLDGKISYPIFRFESLLALARTNLPLSLSGFLNAVLNNLPRLILEKYFGLAAVGVFTVVAYFMQAGTMVINAINQALLGRFASMRLERDSRAQVVAIARSLIFISVGLSISGVFVAYLLGETLLVKGFGQAFGAGATLLTLVAFSLTTKLLGIVPQALIHAERKFGLFLIYEALSLLIGFVLLTVLVPIMGLNGAGVSILFVAVFRLVFLSIAAIRILHGRKS